MNDVFKDFFKEIKPIKFKEPLAQTLGAFKEKDAVIEYSFIDTVKMAGHACPTVAAAYICCQKAMDALYPDQIPVRGDISIKIFGEQDEGVYGVIGQVFSLLTGAAPKSGFRGLGPKFKRKDLLTFDPEKPDPNSLCFEFKRQDNEKAVLIKFDSSKIPFSNEKSEKMGGLMEKVLWEAATQEEEKEFQDLWMEKIKLILLQQEDINKWLTIEEVEDE